MTTLVGDEIFKRFLIFLILLLFAILLLYTDYLQEVNFYQNKLQLHEFKVDFDTFKLLHDSSILNQDKLRFISKKLEKSKTSDDNKINEEQIDFNYNDDIEFDNQYAALSPPFPNIDLTSIGPVFIENGLIHLYCEFSFDTIRCTVGGRVLPEKNYLPIAYFTNPNFENIAFSLNWKDLIDIIYFQRTRYADNENIGWFNQEVLKSNKANIELFTNYIMLFGSNGTYMNMFNNKFKILNRDNNEVDKNNPDDNDHTIGLKYRYCNFIHTQICVLFLIVYLKLVNFLLFLFTVLFQFGMHIPIYFLSIFRYGKNNSMTDLEKQMEEMDMTGFEEWIKYNELIEEKLLSNDMDTLNVIPTKKEKDFNSCNNNLRLRRASLDSFPYLMKEGSSTGVDETYTIRLQDIRKLYGSDDETSFINGNNSEEPINLASTLTNYDFDSNKVENQETNDDITLVNGSTGIHESIIAMSSLDQVVDKYYLFYLSTCIFMLFHLIIYEIINMVLYNMISSIFENLSISNANDLHIKNTSILRIPTIFVGSTTIYDKNIAGTNIVTFGNHIFDCLLNFLGCFSNLLLAIIFHGIYIICIYTYTVSIY